MSVETQEFDTQFSSGVQLATGFHVLNVWSGKYMGYGHSFWAKVLVSSSLLLALGLTTSCGIAPGGTLSQKNPESGGNLPTISSFTASAASISAGSSATLTWTVTNATSVKIDNGIGAVQATGSQPVSPTKTTTYTLTAQNGSKSATATVTIAVNDASQHASITSFAVNPTAVQPNSSATLTWATQNAATVSIDNGIGQVASSGSQAVTPSTTTTYTLTAVGTDNQSVTAQATLTVQNGAIAVVVSPASTQISVGATQQFNAQVTNSSNTQVNWSVDGVSGGNAASGTISTSGLYTAPSATGQHTITATSQADTTKSGTATVTVVAAQAHTSVYTYAYGNLRTGANTTETQLTPAAVTNGANFGKKGSWVLDGNIYAAPLYVPGETINGGTYNVLYAATENDSVYALDASTPGKVLWKRSFLENGATVGHAYTGGRSNVGDEVGITGTPVIDPSSQTMYLVTRTTESGNNVFRLRAIDIRSGNDVMPSTVITATVPGTGMGTDGNGNIPFDSYTQNQRTGLLLSQGIVYVAFASWGDYTPYHGWLFSYDASSLQMKSVYISTPNGGGGGFWQGGAAPAADAAGNVYLASANGMPNATAVFDPPVDMNNSVLKFAMVNGTLTMVDYFSPYNSQCMTNDDLDLGSTGPVLIPDEFGGHAMLAVGSKEGRVYLVDQNNPGKFNAGSDSQIIDSYLFNPQGACGSSTFDADTPWRMYGSPVYWNGNIYFGTAFGPVQQYDITSAKLNRTHVGTHTTQDNGQLGRAPLVTLSANGNTNGILWSEENDLSSQGWLRAYDATNVSNQLFVDNFGSGSNLVVPVVADGNVYVMGAQAIYQYGLLH